MLILYSSNGGVGFGNDSIWSDDRFCASLNRVHQKKNRSTRKLFHMASSNSYDDGHSIVAIIAAKNEERVIEPTVRSLLSKAPKNFKVIVVDDNSTDSTYDILTKLAKEFPNLIILHNFDVPGKSGALNSALKLVKEDIVLFLDADARVDWDFVKEYSTLFDLPGINVVFADFESYNRSRTLAVILQDLYFSFIKTFVYSGLFSKTMLRLMKNKVKVNFVMGKKCRIQYALNLKDLFFQHCRWYIGGIKKIAQQISQGHYFGILVYITIGALVLFPLLIPILAYSLDAKYLLSVVFPLFFSALYSSAVASYLFYNRYRPKDMLVNITLGFPLGYVFFQLAIFFSLVRAFGKKSVWHKVKREEP